MNIGDWVEFRKRGVACVGRILDVNQNTGQINIEEPKCLGHSGGNYVRGCDEVAVLPSGAEVLGYRVCRRTGKVICVKK